MKIKDYFFFFSFYWTLCFFKFLLSKSKSKFIYFCIVRTEKNIMLYSHDPNCFSFFYFYLKTNFFCNNYAWLVWIAQFLIWNRLLGGTTATHYYLSLITLDFALAFRNFNCVFGCVDNRFFFIKNHVCWNI
jgi:hypothetical protein